MAWADLEITQDDLEGYDAFEFGEGSEFDFDSLTPERMKAVRGTLRDEVDKALSDFVVLWSDDDAFFDALQGAAALSGRLTRCMAVTLLWHWYHTTFNVPGDARHERAKHYRSEMKEQVMLLAQKAYVELTPPDDKETSGRRNRSVIVQGAANWGTIYTTSGDI